MAKVKVFQKKVKLQGQGLEVKNNGTIWKVLSQGIHMCNMKTLSLVVRKLWPRLKFIKSRSNFKVKVTRSKIMVPSERSCHKNTHVQYGSPITSSKKVMAKVKVFFTHTRRRRHGRRRRHQGYDISSPDIRHSSLKIWLRNGMKNNNS